MTLSASAGRTAAETKQSADKLFKTTKSTGTPATGLLKFERDGFVSLCSPAAPYKEEGYWVEKSGFKIVDLGLGGACKKVYVHPSVPEHDIRPDAIACEFDRASLSGLSRPVLEHEWEHTHQEMLFPTMPLRVLLLDF